MSDDNVVVMGDFVAGRARELIRSGARLASIDGLQILHEARVSTTPDFFGIIEGLKLAGRECAGCARDFDPAGVPVGQDNFAYVAKFESLWNKKGDAYHPYCVDEWLVNRFYW
jgi:hypothetical protein